jgi:hypothetical protein
LSSFTDFIGPLARILRSRSRRKASRLSTSGRTRNSSTRVSGRNCHAASTSSWSQRFRIVSPLVTTKRYGSPPRSGKETESLPRICIDYGRESARRTMFYDLESAVKNCTTRLWPDGTRPDFPFPFRSFIRFLCMMFCIKRRYDPRSSGDILGCKHLQRFTAFYAHSFPRDLRPRQLRVHFISFRFNNRFDTSARQPSIPYLPRHWVPPHCLDFVFCMRIAVRYLLCFHIPESDLRICIWFLRV